MSEEVKISNMKPANITGGMDSVEYIRRVREGLPLEGEIENIEDALNQRIAELEAKLAETKRANLRQRVEDLLRFTRHYSTKYALYHHHVIGVICGAFKLDLDTQGNDLWIHSQREMGLLLYEDNVVNWLIEQGVEGNS